MRRNETKRSTITIQGKSKAGEHPSSRSPIKKMLIKKIVSYYDTLSTSRTPSPSKNQTLYQNTSKSTADLIRSPSSSCIKKTIMSPKKTEFEKDHQIEYYQDYYHRNTKLDKLQNLMKVEIEKVREGILGNEVEKLEMLKKSVTGYPTFMKEKEDKLKHKEMQRRGSEELDTIERVLEEQGIEISEEKPYLGSTALKIVQQEYNQVHFQDPAELLQERVEHAEDNPVSEGEESLEDERDVQLLRGNTSAEKRHYLRTTGKDI